MANADQAYRSRQQIEIWLALYLIGFGMGFLTAWIMV